MIKLETERLLLRQLQDEDVEAVYAYRSDPDVARYQSSRLYTLEDAKLFVFELKETQLGTVGEWVQLGIILKNEQKLVGDVGIKLNGKQAKIGDIGYTVNPAYQNRGIAKEAVGLVLKTMFTEFDVHKIMATIDPRNIASERLLIHWGFHKEAVFRKHYWDKIDQAWQDEYVYGLLKNEFL